jgi:hypothetical protein
VVLFGFLTGFVLVSVFWATTASAGEAVVSLEQRDDRVRVSVGDELLTEYVFDCFGRPVLYPVIGPHGIAMTRHFPVKPDVPGESHDHPHHTSIWYTHSPVNGINFFDTKPEMGKCVHEKVLAMESGKPRGVLQTATRWVAPDGRVVLTDTRVLGFEVSNGARVIDWQITLRASHGDVVFGDSDHGGLALRMHQNLNLAARSGEKVTATGRALNSEGVTADASAGISGGPVWGKRARWIDYWGNVNGHTVGFAMFDHPSNLRHPTHWMARGYGYCAACPFGLHSFDGSPQGTGDVMIKSGESVTFRYRLVFHEGSPTEANIEKLWQQYAAVPASAATGVKTP